MWGSNKIRSSKIETLIGQSIEVDGDLNFNGGLHLDGKIKGNVTSENDSNSVLVVSEQGEISFRRHGEAEDRWTPGKARWAAGLGSRPRGRGRPGSQGTPWTGRTSTPRTTAGTRWTPARRTPQTS